jgi:membrane AbrB-like protein
VLGFALLFSPAALERGVDVGTAPDWSSLAFALALESLRIPGAFFLGPMLAAVLVAMREGGISVARAPFFVAQGVIGCLMARSIPLPVLAAMTRAWPLFLAVPLSVIAVSTVLGWLLARWRVLPGAEAIWGSSPGAALAMTLTAEAYGADVRLVAFMQYLRLVCVSIAASVVARLWTPSSGETVARSVAFPPIAWVPFIETLALAGLGAGLAGIVRIPAGPLLLPLALGVALQGFAGMRFELPPWLLAASYALVGWSVGLRFTRSILAHAARALPRVLASILSLVAICSLVAAVLVVAAGVDPLTAYLATSPGGADSVAIIAASSNVDLPFVTAMQTTRFVLVLLTGPSLARFVIKRIESSKRPRA